MEDRQKGIGQLAQRLGLQTRHIDQIDPVDLLGLLVKQRLVTINREGYSAFYQAFADFFDEGLITGIDIGIAPGTDDGYMKGFSGVRHRG